MFCYYHSINHIYTPDSKREIVNSLITGHNKAVWIKSLSNKWGRLTQGNNRETKDMDTIDFIYKNEVLVGQAITYALFICDYHSLKEELYYIRIIVEGDHLMYYNDIDFLPADLLESKLLINSTISNVDKGVRFILANIKNHFLETSV